jgi:helix-turn-helix protein
MNGVSVAAELNIKNVAVNEVTAMANAKTTDITLCALEDKAIMIDSQFFGTNYAIDRKGKGMWILVNGKEIAICADQVIDFAEEIIAVWNVYGGTQHDKRAIHSKNGKRQSSKEKQTCG